MTKVSTGDGDNLSTTEYVDFDILGRVKRSIQTTDGVTYGGGSDPNYWMTYSYNLSGALVEQQYPSGRKVKNVLDADGELARVQSKKNPNHAYGNYANHFTYNAAGAVTSMQLGNGRWESTQFNSRLQPTQIALGATQGTTNLLKLDYSYGTTANNGNVLSQTITVPTVGTNTGFTAVQNYNYDSLNRLKDATENITPHGGSQTQSWKQTFTFDRYGNRRFDFTSGATTTPESSCPEAVCNPAVNPSNNRINAAGYLFDAAGNTTRDAGDRKFTCDAENKQVKVESLSPGRGKLILSGVEDVPLSYRQAKEAEAKRLREMVSATKTKLVGKSYVVELFTWEMALGEVRKWEFKIHADAQVEVQSETIGRL